MVAKTPTQMLLEAQNPGKSIQEIIKDALRSNQEDKHMVARTANDLNITAQTLYNWCRELGINTDEFRYAGALASSRK